VSDTIHYRAADNWSGAATIRQGDLSYEVMIDLHVITATQDGVETSDWNATAVGLPLDLLGEILLTLAAGASVAGTVASTGRLCGDGNPLVA
jgi:hypothetical protein